MIHLPTHPPDPLCVISASLSPQGDFMYDSITLDPLETIFTRNQHYLVARWEAAARRAGQIQQWAAAVRIH